MSGKKERDTPFMSDTRSLVDKIKNKPINRGEIMRSNEVGALLERTKKVKSTIVQLDSTSQSMTKAHEDQNIDLMISNIILRSVRDLQINEYKQEASKAKDRRNRKISIDEGNELEHKIKTICLEMIAAFKVSYDMLKNDENMLVKHLRFHLERKYLQENNDITPAEGALRRNWDLLGGMHDAMIIDKYLPSRVNAAFKETFEQQIIYNTATSMTSPASSTMYRQNGNNQMESPTYPTPNQPSSSLPKESKKKK
jgi:hypothetical protein